jgi:RHS repeat-associated protein
VVPKLVDILTYKVANTADLTFNLKNPSGAVVSTTRSSSGSASLSYLTPSGGNYTVEIVNNSTDTDVPSYSQSWSLNSTMTLALKDSTGATIASDASSAKPKTITRSLSPGRYTISATPTGGIATATLTASYPGRPLREVISYTANDHASSIDDGSSTAAETLSPSGRVLRRRVTDDATGDVLEDTTFGYDGPGDSPAYSKPTAGGAITTYINGPAGLLVIDIAGTPTYPIQNGHGDSVGTTDANGAFIPNPPTDEFGVGQTPSNRLGWLGGKERFVADATLGLVRMGVRLYDPSLGRFLEVDPVEGGSANDYDYVNQDPVNGFDLDGTRYCDSDQGCGHSEAATAKSGSNKGAKSGGKKSGGSKKGSWLQQHGTLNLSICFIACGNFSSSNSLSFSVSAVNFSAATSNVRAGSGVAFYGTLGTRQPDKEISLLACGEILCGGGYWNRRNHGFGLMLGVGTPGVFFGFSKPFE